MLNIPVKAKIDTGFQGSLTIPKNIAAILSLPILTTKRIRLANGDRDVVECSKLTFCLSEYPEITYTVDCLITNNPTCLFGLEMLELICIDFGWNFVIDFLHQQVVFT